MGGSKVPLSRRRKNAPVRLKPDGSGLKCEKCHRVYPVKDDIPVMLVDEATIEKD